jgi:hypothetical protein
MPFADCISFAGLLAVAAKGATPPGGCAWTPGRVDAAEGAARDTSLLPSEKMNPKELLAAFAK